MKKTNAMRILDKHNIKYKEHHYEADEHFDSSLIADKIHQPVQKLFKTLVTVGKSKKYHVFVLPVHKELDLKKAAQVVSEKSLAMVAVKEILMLTGYVRGGCSPLGMKKQFNTVIDASAQKEDTIIVSGGKIGFQMEVAPTALATVCNAIFAEIAI